MSPNSPKSERTIAKPRIVAGVLSEIDAAGVLLLFSREGSESYQHARLESEFRVPFEESVIRIKGEALAPGSYKVSALFASQRLSFDITIFDAEGNCSFPREIKISDLRRQRRKKFGPEIEYAEIFTENGIVMANPVDMSQNSIALLLTSKGVGLKTGQLVKLLIRGDTVGRDIFEAQLEVKEFDNTVSPPRILLGPINPVDDVTGKGRLRVVPRHEAGQSSFVLAPADDHLGEPVLATVSNLSLTGFQCSIAHSETVAWLMPGSSVTIKDLNLMGSIVWTSQGRVGIRINALDNSETLAKWTELLRGFKIGTGLHHSQAEELVNLFTESGLLKGKRRKLYGEVAQGYLPPDSMVNNPLLYHRLTAQSNAASLHGHISMARLCDDLWYFQEGANTGDDPGTYRKLYIQTILASRYLYNSSRQSPRYLSGLFHSDIKSAGVFGAELFEDKSSRVYQLMQLPISLNASHNDASTSINLAEIADLDADERRAALSPLDATLCEAFVGWNGTHPRLNAELAKVGPHHVAKTILVKHGSETVGLAFRLMSYYSLNSTGVMNSLFLVVRADVTSAQIKDTLKQLVRTGFAFGTDDAAVIACAAPGQSLSAWDNLVQAKPYTFFIVDNRLNRVFLGGRIEDEVDTTARKAK